MSAAVLPDCMVFLNGMKTFALSAAMVLALAIPLLPAGHATAAPPEPGPPDRPAALSAVADAAESIEPLETLLVAVDGETVVARGYRGHSPDKPTNIKSASKSVVSALVGVAIGKGLISGPDQRISTLLADRLPKSPDPRLTRVTVGNLLSMQAGLEPVSGPRYGSWIASRDWVRDALARPFTAEPGGPMLYSTGNSHLLSAILTRVGGRPTIDLARDWFAPVDGFRIASWSRDPQGIHLGGNQMAMTPRSLLAFGELYRNDGMTADGVRVLPEGWVKQSWTARTTSRHTGDGYGYGWFLRRVAGQDVHYAWGYGGQMLYVVPGLALTVVMTSDESRPSASTGHRDRLNGLLAEVMAAVAPDRGTAADAVTRPAARTVGDDRPPAAGDDTVASP